MSFQTVLSFTSLFVIFTLLSTLVQGVTVSNSTEAVPTYTWRYNASSSIDTNINLGVNSTGTAYALACQAASQSWSRASSAALEAASSTWPVVSQFTSTWTLTSSLWDIWTTDCEGITHVRGKTPTSTMVYATSTVWTNYTITPSYTLPPEPSCAIQPSDCKVVLESWSAESSAEATWESQFAVPFYITNRPPSPMCTSVCTMPTDCMIMADHVELIYWPVTTTGANSCGTNGTTVTNDNDGPSTIVTLGMTFTSPTPYLSFRSISAWDWGCNTQIGEGVSGTILTIPPGQLSSARGWHLGRSAYSFNLADLNGFVTSAAFFQMQGYDWSGPDRNTIFDDLYFPTVWLPDAITELKPEWRTCDLSPFGVNDPPIQLTTVKYVEPTTTKDPIKTPGYELHTSAKPGATATTTPEASALPQESDPLANPSRGGKSTKQGSAVAVPTATKNPGNSKVADWIAFALGYTTAPQPTQIFTMTIYLGTNGFSMRGKKSTLHVSDFLQQVASRTAAPPPTAGSAVYAIAYETVDGHTAVIGDGMTLSIGGPASEIDGYTVSAADGGLVVNSLTVPYMVEASKTSSGTAAASSSKVSDSSAAGSSSRTIAQPAEATSSASSSMSRIYQGLLAIVATLLATFFII